MIGKRAIIHKRTGLATRKKRRPLHQSILHISSQWNDCIRPVSVAECTVLVLMGSTLSAVYEVTCVREAHTLRAIDKVKIGITELRVSRLGLGGVALSGAPPSTDPHQTTSEAEAVALIQGSLAL